MSKDKKTFTIDKEVLAEVAKEAAGLVVAELKPELEKVSAKKPVAGKAKLELEGKSKKEKIALYMKAVYQKDLDTMKAISGKSVNTGTDSAGGFLVWEEWAKSIDKAAREQGITREIANVIPMAAQTLHLPKGAASTSVTWPGEGAALTESNPTFAETALVAKKLAGISTATREAIEDAVADVVDYITTDIGESIAQEEDNQMLNGTGSSPSITGVLVASGVNEVVMSTGDTSFVDVSSDYLQDVVDAVEHQRRTDAVWVMSDFVFGLVKKLKDSQNRPLYQALTEAERGFLLGYRVVVSNQAPESGDDAVSTTFIAFGNFKRGVAMGLRKDMTVDISDSAVVDSASMFEEDKLAIRVIERIDIAVHLGVYLSRLKTAAS